MKTQARGPRITAVKIGVSRQVAIPKRIHDQLGLAPGDYLQVELQEGKVILTPQAMVEKRLVEGLDDIRKGHVRGPFESATEALRSLPKTDKTVVSSTPNK